MRKLLSLLLVAIMATGMSTTAFAAESADTYFDKYVNDFEKYIESSATHRMTSASSPVEIVQTFIEENGEKYDVLMLQNSTQTRSIDLGNENAIILDGIMIYVNGTEDVEAIPERIAKGAVDTTLSAYDATISPSAAQKTTPIKSYYHAVYAVVLGQELYRITQEAQFTYDGSSVSANYSDGYYERGFLSIWQVDDFEDSKESSITTGGVYYARVKSSANFHYGLEIKGVGLVIQDNNCWVDVRCSKSGTVNGYMDGGHDL